MREPFDSRSIGPVETPFAFDFARASFVFLSSAAVTSKASALALAAATAA